MHAFKIGNIEYLDPYAYTKMALPIDLKRIRNGEPKYICVADFTGSDIRCGWFDETFELQPFYVKGKRKIEAPEIDVNIARELWDCSKKIYFAELTFTPLSGFMLFEPIEYERILGDMIDLHK